MFNRVKCLILSKRAFLRSQNKQQHTRAHLTKCQKSGNAGLGGLRSVLGRGRSLMSVCLEVRELFLCAVKVKGLAQSAAVSLWVFRQALYHRRSLKIR